MQRKWDGNIEKTRNLGISQASNFKLDGQGVCLILNQSPKGIFV